MALFRAQRPEARRQLRYFNKIKVIGKPFLNLCRIEKLKSPAQLIYSIYSTNMYWVYFIGCIFKRQIGEGNGNPLQCSCLENPSGRGAWWAAVYGAAESDMTEAT